MIVALLVLIAGLSSLAMGCWLPHSAWIERLAWGWLAAEALIGVLALMLWLIGAPLVWALIAVPVLLGVAWWRPTPGLWPAAGRQGDRVLRAVAVALAVWAVISAYSSSGLGWDGLAIWGLKGRLLFDGAYSWQTLGHPLLRSSHPEYPLHLPLVSAVIAQAVGAWHSRILPLLTAFDLGALWLLLASHFETAQNRGRLSLSTRAWRIVVLLALASVPILWHALPQGKADLALGVFIAAAVVGLEAWCREGQRAYLVLAALAAGMGAATKQEGMIYLGLLGATALVAGWLNRRLDQHAFVGLVFAGALALPWPLARFWAGVATEPFSPSANLWQRLPVVCERMVREMMRLERWGLLWGLVILTLVLAVFSLLAPSRAQGIAEDASDAATKGAGKGAAAAKGARHFLIPACLVVGGWLFIVAAYATTPHDLAWHLDTSLERLMLQLVPTAGLLLYGAGRDIWQLA